MKALALLAIAAIVLSGCASPKDDDTPTGSGTASATATKATTSTKGASTATGTGGATTGNATAGHAPAARLAATGLEGAAPFNVTFTINGTDADGDDLSWSLDFGDGSSPALGTGANGTLAAAASHLFAVGNHTAVLNVTAGPDSAFANVTIVVLAGGAPSGPLVDATLTVVFGCELCTDGEGAAIPCFGLAAGVNEADCAWVELTAEAVGRTFTVTGSSPSPLPDPAPHGMNPEAAILASCAVDAAVLAFHVGSNTQETGTIPAGAGCLVAWDYDETWVTIDLHVLVA